MQRASRPFFPGLEEAPLSAFDLSRRLRALAFPASLRRPAGALVLVLAFPCLFPSCSSIGPGKGQGRLTVMSYNVHNLFDAEDSGLEYPEFSVAGGNWDSARYRARLEGLAEVVRAAAPLTRGPDLVCLVEIENQAVLEALRRGPLASSGYSRSLLAPASGQAVNCGILSRWPVLGLKVHGAQAGGRTGRYILEASFDVSGRRLTVFLCHWKSKLGGAEATEAERRCAAALVAGRAAALLRADPAAEFLVCGDFNEGPDEYLACGKAYQTALLPAGAGGADSPKRAEGLCLLVAASPEDAGLEPDGSPALYSPWAASDGWSYLMDGRGERIDGFLLSPGLLDGEGLSMDGFFPLDADFLLDASGAPVPYNARTGAGYSDHLPVVLTLSLAGTSP